MKKTEAEMIRKAIHTVYNGSDTEEEKAIEYLREVGDIEDIEGYIWTGDVDEQELLEWFNL